ncbi:UDP-glucuronosyltransferase 2B31-like [Acanthaster planci]|uniref:UDP-glucuronosyltransferase 2B31-like n=1 Tax=Acanthaster planci TaxID=133434 RepID=A0A8B7XV06_ACAPL|nr:UDP-glucuronosyltransferase 2B31-like [Acanthaster planci]
MIDLSFPYPSRAGLPVNPSYIPDIDLELTDRMTILQRVKNVLAHYYHSYFSPRSGIIPIDLCDELKVKYNIRPEIIPSVPDSKEKLAPPWKAMREEIGKNEALWNGLPIVGMPFLLDQGENINRIEAQGAGLRLDITTLTQETLSGTIRRVMEEPRFRENAQRISKIMRDLQGTENPIDNMVRWILHVTRLGGEHLRPAVMELNVVQRYLLDVYLLIGVVVVAIFGVSVSGCRFGWKCLFDKGKDGKYKKE